MNLSAKEIAKLPNILDVMEMLAESENSDRIKNAKELHPWKMLEEGYFMPISSDNDKNLVKFLPTGPCFGKYYRGQNQYYPYCKPTLLRKRALNDRMLSRLKANEFQIQILTHPIIQELVQHGVDVNLEALAQHYGFDTKILDLTNDKWVAAFFATTQYKNGDYYPVGSDFGEGYGVLYVAKSFLKPFNSANFELLMARTDSIGFQFFPRPTSQSAYGFLMNDGENFDDSVLFDKFFFRHDQKASEWVFEISYRQKKYFPNDTLTQIANCILQDNGVSSDAVLRCQKYDYPKSSVDELKEICVSQGFEIYDHSKHGFSDEMIKNDVEEWESYGRNVFAHKTITPRLVSSCPK